MAAQHCRQTPPLVWRRPSGQYVPAPGGFTVRGHAPRPAFRDPREVLEDLRQAWSAYGWIIRWHQPTSTWTANRGDMTLKRTDPIALGAALAAAQPPRYGTTSSPYTPSTEGTAPR
jgi:hypothetical protein